MFISCKLISSRIQSVVVHTFLSLISSLAFGIPNELSHQLSGKLTCPLLTWLSQVLVLMLHCFYFTIGNVKGKIIFHQMEGNSTYLRDSGKLASYIPTVVSFELSDPRHNLHSVKFIYTWDMGNG